MIDSATGKYFSFVASDDAILPYKVAEQVKILEDAGDEYAMVYGNLIEIDEEGKVIEDPRYTMEKLRSKDFVAPSGDIFKEVLKGIFFYNQTALINFPLLLKSGFRFNTKVLPEDWDLQLTLSRNYKIIASPKPYAKYRIVEQSFSHTYLKKQNLHKLYESIIYMLMKYLEHPLNTAEDKAAIMARAREIYWYLKRTPAFNRKDQVKYDLLFFKKTFAPKDLIAFLKSTAGYVVGAKQFKPADEPVVS